MRYQTPLEKLCVLQTPSSNWTFQAAPSIGEHDVSGSQDQKSKYQGRLNDILFKSKFKNS